MVSDRLRQWSVLLGSLVALAGALVGSGALGGPDQTEIGEGALAPDATPVAPGSPAFSIWSVIYAGLIGYAIWQALPAQRADPRQRSLGWAVLASMLLNALWIAVVQSGLLGVSVLVIVALLLTLCWLLVKLEARPPGGRVEAVLADGTLGLYLGWVVVATIANVAAVLADRGSTGLVLSGEAWAILAAALAAIIGVALARRTGGRLAIGAAITWGLAWIAVARLTGELHSVPVAVAATIAAAVVATSTVTARLTARRAP